MKRTQTCTNIVEILKWKTEKHVTSSEQIQILIKNRENRGRIDTTNRKLENTPSGVKHSPP